MFKWKLPVLLFAIFCYLQYSLWFGKNNVSDYQQAEQNVEQVQAENNQLKLRNEQMFAETADLHDGLEAVEERARSSLGMIKPGEHFYRIIADSDNE
ncbi:cell division protein FtsB [Zophobihabitans entericus]|uniref:Cell division protein FtsB n=1 Tax=Zophobihabitans entericus TaxID=1635327 RepID=A0A6G9IB60_9GAMM|nr:cell division protein FtsB [Zophobihabitans entericus]QIQ21062.1 cell division protein FtsB [Zophobihabitans entericus]